MPLSSHPRTLSRLIVLTLLATATIFGISLPASASPYGSISGTVTGPDGLPANGIDVRVVHQDASGAWMGVAFDSTDSHGRFQLWAPPGTQRLALEPHAEESVYLPTYYPNAESIEAAADIVVTSDSSHDVAVELRAGPRADLGGTVRGTDGAPLSEVQVQVWTNRGSTEAPLWVNRFLVATDGAGEFREVIKPGTYRLSYRKAGYQESFPSSATDVTSAPDVTVENGDTARFDAVLTKQNLIRGKVLAFGRKVAVPGTRVDFYRNIGTTADPLWSREASATPDWTSGTYAKHLTPGDYLVRAVDPLNEYLDEYYGMAMAARAARVVTLAPESTVPDITIQLTERRAIPLGSRKPPEVSGTALLGQTLTASAGVWSETPATVTYRWLSDGVPIPGATESSYVLRAADVGHTFSVRVDAYRTGRYPARQTSSASAVVLKSQVVTTPTPPVRPAVTPRLRSTTTVRARSRGNRTTITVTVKAGSRVTGTIRVLRAGKPLTTLTLRAGKASLTLRAPRRGRTQYTVVYLGSKTLLPSSGTARARTVRIR